ncbi:MAG TPA: DUF2491 family protein [Azospirillaceae bacterium]|nr:DUF2491 family protein [Azospirillaceae bacterium]
MPVKAIRHKTGALFLSLLLALTPVAGAFLATLVVAEDAQARSRSSSGYSRPSGGFSARTPSVGSSSSRTPSVSGGYSRPSQGGFSFGAPSSPGDAALSRRSAGDALSRYRAQQQPPVAPTRPSGPDIRVPRSGGDYDYPRDGGWFGSRGWSPPRYAYGSRPSFGLWDGLFLWFLLDNLTSPGHAAWFYNHQSDPGVQAWRSEAERLAQDTPDLKSKLGQLDSQVAQMQGRPRDPDYIPPDVPAEVALADDVDRRTPGVALPAIGGVVPVVLIIGGGVLFILWRARRQAAGGRRSSAGDSNVGNIRSAAGIIRHKLSGEGYTPSLFRVGMAITLDPTPFILAQGATKVEPPTDVSGTNTLVSVEAVGTVTARGAAFHRLHLPEGRGFFQLHLDANSQPDECRFFRLYDEVVPASEEEWGFWLDPTEGMIGWPQFQTKDGKLYARVWSPGEARVEPVTITETMNTVQGMRILTQTAMLYAAPTGLTAPAPETEYLLAAVDEEEGQASVRLYAGIDVNPAALSLS